MKAEIITQMFYEGTLAIIHGESHRIEIILIPEKNNLVITLDGENLYIWDNFQKDDCNTVGEIEIPDELVEKAVNFMKSRNFLLKQFQKFVKR